MAEDHKNIALVILGIVAVIAVVGLVLLFVRGKSATGEGVYGGAIKEVAFPYWEGRGTPRNIPGEIPGPGYQAGSTPSANMQTHWNFYDDGNDRNPLGNIPTVMTACSRGCFGISAGSGNLPLYYANQGYGVYPVEGYNGQFACVCPREAMVGGIAGYT